MADDADQLTAGMAGMDVKDDGPTVDDARACEELSAAGFTPEVISDLRTRYEKQRATNGFTIGTHLSCLKASAAADAAYGPGFKELNEEQKYHVWNAPYTAAVTGEDAADIIDKLRSVYQKGRADKVVAPVADTKDETPGLATRIVLAAAAAGDAAGAPAAAAAAGVKKQKKRKPQFSPNPNRRGPNNVSRRDGR
jgi:hypothetical protein